MKICKVWHNRLWFKNRTDKFIYEETGATLLKGILLKNKMIAENLYNSQSKGIRYRD